MTLQYDHYKAQLGQEVIQAEKNITELVGDMTILTTRMTAVRDEVLANADGIFDNPADLNWLNARLTAMRSEIRNFANGL